MRQYYLTTPYFNESHENQTFQCVPLQIALPDLIDRSSIQGVLGFCYSLVWLMGVLGNLTVLYMVLLRRVDFTVRTVFIVSLATSDLIMGFTSLPITAVATFSRVWIFTDFLCYSIGFLQACSVFVSSFTLITIAVDRYYLIYYPHSIKITYEKAKIAVFVFWCTGALLAVPTSAFTKIEHLDGICGKICHEQWSWEWGRRMYGLTVFSIQYGLPLLICSTLYVLISFKISYQCTQRALTQRTISAASNARCIMRKKRSNRMMAMMVVTFVLAWLPINILNIVRDFDVFQSNSPHLKYFTLAYASGHLAAMSSLIWNPIIYSWFNYKFRRSLKGFIGIHGSKRMVLDGTTTAV